MALRGIDSLGPLEGRVVGVRLDLNVPLKGGEITDDGRIHAALPTLRTLADRGAKMVVMSHLGRPDGTPDSKHSLRPVATRLQKLWSGTVTAVDQVTGSDVAAAISNAAAGDIVLVENLRFDARETSKDGPERARFAEELATPLDCVVSDGFGVVHRAQASVVELAEARPSAAGLLIETE
ncbi:MAG: phosphoglycerate kinase, partial [Pontimonas sp.]